MENKCSCVISEEIVNGIKVVYLENDLIRLSLLVGKGCELYEIIYKPLNMDILLKSKGGLEQYKGRELSKERLTWYSELFTGGWMDVLPDRGTYGDVYLVQKNSGIAATVPWDYEILEQYEDKITIKCFVILPLMPLYVEKTITIVNHQSKIYVNEYVKNVGNLLASFTWTQHATFGGEFLDEYVKLTIPCKKVFKAIEYEQAKGKNPEDYECPIENVKMSDETVYNLLTVKPNSFDEELFVTVRDLEKPYFNLYNEKKGVGVRFDWDYKAFPYLRYWYKNSKDLYTIGIEPSNYYFDGFDNCIEKQTCFQLEPTKGLSTWYTCELYT
ncbi:MAG TPA: DUF4432 family protein [Ruminiclostridium sp.]